ncbi:aquaporin-11-like [Aquarana catesbeiana]|uniref:aquaporin-11-like n=1 Tax=Aquarana catesbeiana TaxID=8400 RepID=UPI003CCA3C8C
MDVLELLLGSAALVACTVLLCELLRWACHRIVPKGLGLELALEVVSTVQLCCCTLEVDLLCTKAEIELWLLLVLIYLLTVLHCLTFQGASCNPCGSVNQWLRGLAQGSQTVLKVMAQFAGAGLSWMLMPHLWSLRLSPLHQLGKDCESPLQVSPLSGALVEMACAISLFLILHPLPRVSAPLQPHMVALTITGIAYAGGPLTGAIFNPVLAFAVVFLCHGHSYLQYIIVYWLGPLIGMLLSFLVLEYMLPKLQPGRVKRD